MATKLQVTTSEEPTLSDSSSQNIRNYQKDGPGAGELVVVVTYLAMSLVGSVLNGSVLLAAWRNIDRLSRSRTNVHYLVIHLTLADTLVSMVVMPMEAGWKFTSQWAAGDLACKFLMFIRALGYYLSSAILVALSIDRCIVVGGIYINYVLPRYLTVSYPLSILQTSKQRKKARLGVVLSWLLSVVLSLPQLVMFRTVKHPELDWYQCTQRGWVEALSQEMIVSEDNRTMIFYDFYGFEPLTIYNMYHAFFLFFVYFLPLTIFVVTYKNVITALRRRDEMLERLHGCPSLDPNNFLKSQRKKLRMSLIQVLAFLLCWGPYVGQQVWKIIDWRSSVELLPDWVYEILLLSLCLNSCINPIIYGAYYCKDLKIIETKRDRSSDIRMQDIRGQSSSSLRTSSRRNEANNSDWLGCDTSGV